MDVPGSKLRKCLSSFCPLIILGGAGHSKEKKKQIQWNIFRVKNRNWAKEVKINMITPCLCQLSVTDDILQSLGNFKLSFLNHIFFLYSGCRWSNWLLLAIAHILSPTPNYFFFFHHFFLKDRILLCTPTQIHNFLYRSSQLQRFLACAITPSFPFWRNYLRRLYRRF